MKKKLKLNNLNMIEKKNLAKVKGGEKPIVCAGCLCSGGIDATIATDGGSATMD